MRRGEGGERGCWWTVDATSTGAFWSSFVPLGSPTLIFRFFLNGFPPWLPFEGALKTDILGWGCRRGGVAQVVIQVFILLGRKRVAFVEPSP